MAYKQTMGKGPAMKTGAGIPKKFMGPAMHEGVVHEGKKPKGTTTRTQERTTQNGQAGTLTTDTTVTPGYKTSADFTGKPRPTYGEFGAGGGDVVAAKKWNRERPGSTDVQSRFNPDPTTPLTTPVIPGKANIKAEGIKQGIKFTPPAPKEKYTRPKQGVIDWIGEKASDVGQALTPGRKMGRGMKRSIGTRFRSALRGCFGGGC